VAGHLDKAKVCRAGDVTVQGARHTLHVHRTAHGIRYGTVQEIRKIKSSNSHLSNEYFHDKLNTTDFIRRHGGHKWGEGGRGNVVNFVKFPECL